MEFYAREKYLEKIRPFYGTTDLIKVITGVRRCGKSTLLLCIAKELRQQGVDDDHIVFIDLDAREFRNITTPDALEKIIDERTPKEGKVYLFIDEIQNVKKFEPLINGYRVENRFSLFLTGSNSYLLSGELVTKLTGRYIEFEMFPLTYDEYEDMKDFYGIKKESDTVLEFNHYLQEGGFPRLLFLESDSEKKTYIRSLIQEIFEKDVHRRVKIRSHETFDRVRDFVVGNFGATFSLSSLTEALNRAGIQTTRNTVRNYIDVLTDAKILYPCPRFDIKSKRALNGERKYYLVDFAFYFFLSPDANVNYGPFLENCIYFYARSFDYNVSVGKIGNLECDFIVRNRSRNYAFLQVAYTILSSPKTEEREYRALESIRDASPKYILTTDRLLKKRNGIRHVCLMDFMIKKSQFC